MAEGCDGATAEAAAAAAAAADAGGDAVGAHGEAAAVCYPRVTMPGQVGEEPVMQTALRRPQNTAARWTTAAAEVCHHPPAAREGCPAQFADVSKDADAAPSWPGAIPERAQATSRQRALPPACTGAAGRRGCRKQDATA